MIRIEVEEAQHELRAVLRDQRHELAAGTVVHVRVDHLAFRLHGRAGTQRRERHDARVVLVAQRQVQHEILLARDAELRELIGEAAAGARLFLRLATPFRAGSLRGRDAGRLDGHVQRANPIAFATGVSSMMASTSTSAPRGSAATW